MARGDVVSDIQSIAAAANLDFQPAAGVEVMITEIGSSVVNVGTPKVTVYLYDGSNASIIRPEPTAQSDADAWRRPLKLFINNSRYLRITNNDGSSRYISYSGIQTK